MVRASDFGPMARGSIPASGCHRMQIGQNAFVTSLPLSTQERAWHDWVVGLGNACVPVSRGRTLMRRVWLPASRMCMKANDGKTVSALCCKRYVRTSLYLSRKRHTSLDLSPFYLKGKTTMVKSSAYVSS